MSLQDRGGKLSIDDSGTLFDDEECCCEEDCNPCCQCWTIRATLGTDTGSKEATGVLSGNNCICSAAPVLIFLWDDAFQIIATVTINFLKITYDKAVIRLTYSDVCCGGSTTEQSTYYEDDVDPDNCDTSISFSVIMPTVGTITLAFFQCCPADCDACPSSYTVTTTYPNDVDTCPYPIIKCNVEAVVTDLVLNQVDDECLWTGSQGNTSVRLECAPGCRGEPTSVWSLQFVGNNGCWERWYATRVGNDCPPTDEGDWTLTDRSTSCYEITTCPAVVLASIS